MRALRTTGLGFFLLASGCAVVSVTPSGGASAPGRPADCSIEFFRSKPPDRPYDELAGLHATGKLVWPSRMQEAMRAKACKVGADAVIVTRDFIPETNGSDAVMTGTAIRFRRAAKQPASAIQPVGDAL